MAMQFKWDLVEPHRIRYTMNGMEITRGCLVTNIPVTVLPGNIAPGVFLSVLNDPGCPQLGTVYPDASVPTVNLEEINPRPASSAGNQCILDLVYRGPAGITPPGGGSPVFRVEYSSTSSVIQTYAAGDGSVAKVWYKSGTADNVAAKPAGAQEYSVQVSKVVVGGSLRATSVMTKATWESFRPSVRRLRGFANSLPWGGDARAKWLFLGPSTSVVGVNSQIVTVQLDFAEAPTGSDWFQVGYYIDANGQHPADSAAESVVRAAPPAAGGQTTRNGITLISVQGEAEFGPLFSFSPATA